MGTSRASRLGWFRFVCLSGLGLGLDEAGLRAAVSQTLAIPTGYSYLTVQVAAVSNAISALLPAAPEGLLVVTFDATTQRYRVNQFQRGIWAQPEDVLDPGRGLVFINPGAGFQAVVSGERPATSTPPLVPGGNLVGLPSQNGSTLPLPREADTLIRLFPHPLGTAGGAAVYIYSMGRWNPDLPVFDEGEAFWYWKAPGVPQTTNGTVLLMNYVPALQVNGATEDSAGAPLNTQVYYELRAGAEASNLQPVVTRVPGSVGDLAGLLFGGVVEVPFLPARSSAFCQVVFWLGEAQNYDQALANGMPFGESEVTSVRLGGASTLPAYLPPALPAALTNWASSTLVGNFPPLLSLRRGSPRLVTTSAGSSSFLPSGDLCGLDLLNSVYYSLVSGEPGEGRVVARDSPSDLSMVAMLVESLAGGDSPAVACSGRGAGQPQGTLRFSMRTNTLYFLAISGYPDPALYLSVSDPPAAQDDQFVLQGGLSLSVQKPGVLANDHASGAEPLSARVVSLPAKGQLTLSGDGSFTYNLLDPAFVGTDSFSYEADDGVAASVPATVTIRIGPPPGPPRLAAARTSANTFRLVLDAPEAATYAVDESTRLPSWSELKQVSVQAGSTVVLERPLPDASTGFFRVRRLP